MTDEKDKINKETENTEAEKDNAEVKTEAETAAKEDCTEKSEKSENAEASENTENTEKPEDADAKEQKKDDKKKKKCKECKDDKSDELKKAYDELNDRYLRMAAEYDNYRKRTQKEREAAYTDAAADVLKEIIPVIDTLERAAQFGDGDKLSEGVNMTLKMFEEVLKKLGVEEIKALGEQFDPELHNAVMHGEDPEMGENIVTDVFQKGYKKGDKVIRYAMVKVVN